MEKPKVEAIEINATSITLEWHLQKDYADKVEITFCTVRNKDCESNTVNAHDGSWTKNGLTELTKYVESSSISSATIIILGTSSKCAQCV